MSEMRIERLTDAERAAITNCTDEAAWHAGCEAPRIIDRLTAALEAAEKDRDNWKHWRATAVKACDRCEEREKALQARVAELEAERDDWKKTAQAGCYTCPQEHSSRLAAESELADLRERVERALKALAGYYAGEGFTGPIHDALEALRGR